MTTLTKTKDKIKKVRYPRGAGGYTHDNSEILWPRPAEDRKRELKTQRNG